MQSEKNLTPKTEKGENYAHGNKLRTLLAFTKSLKKSLFLFSGDTEFFITCILCLDQFMGTHNILSLCYGGHNMPHMKTSTLTEYEFALLFLHSAKLIFEYETGMKC